MVDETVDGMGIHYFHLFSLNRGDGDENMMGSKPFPTKDGAVRESLNNLKYMC